VGGAYCGFGLTDSNTLCEPRGIAFDSSGNLWVSDWADNRVLMFKPPFTEASLVLGQSDFSGIYHNEGYYQTTPTNTGLNSPSYLAFDSSGNLWVSDSANNRVLEYTPTSIAPTTPITVVCKPNTIPPQASTICA